ncbi:hypothetical protein AK812_SmicGene11366 [Symbiodinium microadriaticum]|uniref:Uncharacterized protein n=1 Tax=Symbiodinium microadriaticum TaxID=2951 RepID=A0A1Q9EDD8_SYMMI|nr:hypothetical protein AK812_SmicGene11366 [Symbiodinium microadriaticum]
MTVEWLSRGTSLHPLRLAAIKTRQLNLMFPGSDSPKLDLKAALESAAQQMLTDVANKGFAQADMDTVLQVPQSRGAWVRWKLDGYWLGRGFVAEQLTAAAVTAAKEQPRNFTVAESVVAAAARQVERTPSTAVMETEISQVASPLPPLAVALDLDGSHSSGQRVVTAEVLAPTSSVVEVVATDEEPEAQVPATKPVVEEAPGDQELGSWVQCGGHQVSLQRWRPSLRRLHRKELSFCKFRTAGLDIVPRPEQGSEREGGQPIADTAAHEATDAASASVLPESGAEFSWLIGEISKVRRQGRLGETVVHDILHSVAEKEEPATAVASSPSEVQVPTDWITPEAPAAVSAPGSAAQQPTETVTPAPVVSTSPVPSEHISHAGQAPAIAGPGSAADEPPGDTAPTAPVAASSPVPSEQVVPEVPSAPGSEQPAPSAPGSEHPPAVPSVPGSEAPVPSAPASEHPAPSAPGSEPHARAVVVGKDVGFEASAPSAPGSEPHDVVSDEPFQEPPATGEPVEELPPSEQGRRPPQVPKLWQDTRLEMPAVGARPASASEFSGLSPPRTSLWSPGTGYEGYETDGSGYPDEGSMAEYSYEDPGRTMRIPQGEGSFPHDRSTQKFSAWGAPASRSVQGSGRDVPVTN